MQGNSLAQHNIAQLYIAGDGVAQDFEQAAVWLKQSAAHGFDRSQYTLGKMYIYGLGVAKDPGGRRFVVDQGR